MLTTHAREYFRLRRSGWPAHTAYSVAKTKAEWDVLNGVIVDEHDATDPEESPIRLRIVADDTGYDEGDIFSPAANPGVSPARLERKRKAFYAKHGEDGVWGIIGEYWDGERWIYADSCFGFLGSDLKDNGYDTDIMARTMAQYHAISPCPTCGRPQRS